MSGEKKHGNQDSSKIYLKSDYKAHLGMNDRCADHCVTHALSDSRSVEYCQQYMGLINKVDMVCLSPVEYGV